MLNLVRYRIPGLERRYTRLPLRSAYLVILQTRERSKTFFEETLGEMTELARASNFTVVGTSRGRIPHPSPRYFVREGKLTEIRDEAKKSGAHVLLFSVDLAPAQSIHIESFTDLPVLDRTGLILEIFGRRAKSKEGKLQVELAQLNYTLPHLSGLGTVMSRLGGGIGTRGPGEQELERDRRKIRKRIQQVKVEIERVREHRKRIRSGRKKKRFISIAIVGYTNAGKSTLLNALTGSKAVVEDKAFTTLDPITRVESLNGRQDILFIDTVGLLKNLPHKLVEAFRATLEEVQEADLLIHVLDVSSPHAEEAKKTVDQVLREMEVQDKPLILALNKADLLTEEQRKWAQNAWPEGMLITAKEGLGLNSFLLKLNSLAVRGENPQ